MPETTFSMFTPPTQRALQAGLALAPPPKPAQTLTEKHRPRTLGDMVGQGAAVFRLQAFLEAPYSCAFLFEGPTGVGKTTAALALAAELGAVEFGGLDTIKSGMQDAEAVDNCLRGLHFTPMCGSGWKVVIVDEADYMSPKAAQLWLSALEDLPSRSVIIFTTNHVEKFPDRFLDRCERLQFASDATLHQQDAETLISQVWFRETGRADAPRFDQLAGVVSQGQLSYRRIIRALEPMLAAARLNRLAATELGRPVPVAVTDFSIPRISECEDERGQLFFRICRGHADTIEWLGADRHWLPADVENVPLYANFRSRATAETVAAELRAPAPPKPAAKAKAPAPTGRTRRFDAAEHVDWQAEGERFRAGESCVQIGQRLGLSWNKVYSMLEKTGIDPKRKAVKA